MADAYVSKRVFEIARELKVPTPDIVDYLTGLGHDVTRKQMHPVNEQMYIALLHKFDRPRFEKYLIGHGIVGEDLRKLSAFLDDQKKRVVKPVVMPEKKVEQAKPERPIFVKSARTPRAPQEKSKTLKVTFFRRERKPEPVIEPIVRPIESLPAPSIYSMAHVSNTPQSIPTSPLALELIRLTLALPTERKRELLDDLRRRAAA